MPTGTASLDHHCITAEIAVHVTMQKVCLVSLTHTQARPCLGIISPISTPSAEKRVHFFLDNKTVRGLF